jgi:nucleotide-binding universal stress UspA family protein
MGTTSRHGLNKLIVGSCAAGVIHNAKCPVVTLGPSVKKQARVGFPLRTVVFATDLNHQSVEKAGLALAFAKEGLARVYLCDVLDNTGTDISNSIDRQLDAEAQLWKLVPGPAYEWCKPEFVVEFGNVAERILALAKRTEADLIVLGARHATSYFGRVAKGVVEHVLAEATCPVMTICAD